MALTPTRTGEGDGHLGYIYSLSGSQTIVPAFALTDDSGNQIGTTANPLVTSGGSGASSNQVQGNVASATADSGNPVKVGGVYNSTLPTFTTGQRGDLQVSSRGELLVSLSTSGTTNAFGGDSTDAVATSATSNKLVVMARQGVFNGTTWDRQRGDTSGSYSVTTGSATAAVGVTPVVGAAVSGIVVKASAGNFYGGSVTTNGTAGYLIAYNAAALPTAGAALTAASILGCVYVGATASGFIGEYNIPDRFSTGVVLLFSTSTTTYTAAANLPLHIRGRAL